MPLNKKKKFFIIFVAGAVVVVLWGLAVVTIVSQPRFPAPKSLQGLSQEELFARKLAGNDYAIPAGIMPSSPLYFFDVWGERGRNFFTRKKPDAALWSLVILQEKNAEIRKLAQTSFSNTAMQRVLRAQERHVQTLLQIIGDGQEETILEQLNEQLNRDDQQFTQLQTQANDEQQAALTTARANLVPLLDRVTAMLQGNYPPRDVANPDPGNPAQQYQEELNRERENQQPTP